MIQTSDTDDRLDQVIEKLDQVDQVIEKLDRVIADQEKFNDRFNNYQQATQWVVQLAFTLIASATITVIITSVLRK